MCPKDKRGFGRIEKRKKNHFFMDIASLQPISYRLCQWAAGGNRYATGRLFRTKYLY